MSFPVRKIYSYVQFGTSLLHILGLWLAQRESVGYHFRVSSLRVWRNWQTRMVQVHVGSGP